MNRCRCGRTWSGTSRAHCSGCHLTFTGLVAFEKHRKQFECVKPWRLPGVFQLRNGLWGLPGDRPPLARGTEGEGISGPFPAPEGDDTGEGT